MTPKQAHGAMVPAEGRSNITLIFNLLGSSACPTTTWALCPISNCRVIQPRRDNIGMLEYVNGGIKWSSEAAALQMPRPKQLNIYIY